MSGKKVYSPYSDPTTPVELKMMDVQGLIATGVNKSNIPLTWDKQDGVGGYYIYTCATIDGTYKKIASTSGNSYKVTCSKAGIDPGKYIYIKVISYRKQSGTTYEFDIDSATPISSYVQLAKPAPSVKENKKTYARIGWKKINGAEGYKIEAMFEGDTKVLLGIFEDADMVEYVHDDTSALVYDPDKVVYYEVTAFSDLTKGDSSTRTYSDTATLKKKPKK